MLDTSVIGTEAGDRSVRDAYEALIAAVERALGYDEVADLTAAYQDYADSYVGVLSGTQSPDELADRSRRLADVLVGLVHRPDIADLVDDATVDYLDDLADAVDTLEGRVPDLESLVSVAAATTLLSWLHGVQGPAGLGATDLPGSNGADPARGTADRPFGAEWTDWSTPAATRTEHPPEQRVGRPAGPRAAPHDPHPHQQHHHDDDTTRPASFDIEERQMTDETDRSATSDDDIVWQEFSVGDDGQIVRTTTDDAPAPPPAPAPAPEPSGAPVASGAAGEQEQQPSGARAPRGRTRERRRAERTDRAARAAPSGDPVAAAEDALRHFTSGLARAGVTVDAAALRPPTAPSLLDLERQSADVTASYLRAANGYGSIAELYSTYARLLGSVSELVEQHLTHLRNLERLGTTGVGGPIDRGQAADQAYEQFVAEIQRIWADIDPSDVDPAALEALNQATAQAAALHDAATGRGRQR